MAEEINHLTWRQLWAQATNVCSSQVAARWLCEHASGVDGAQFEFVLGEFATTRCVAHLDAMLARVTAGEPLQYVMGRWGFRHLDVMVDSRVLIPRPETEVLAGMVIDHCRFLNHLDKKVLVADLGTGSGVIGLSVLFEMPVDSCVVWMTDISDDAIHVARANAVGIGQRATHARFSIGHWCDALPNESKKLFDVIVANPPYIANNDPELDPSVALWEPPGALFAGNEGLDDINIIVKQSKQWLSDGGMLALEMGYQQSAQVTELFSRAGFSEIVVHRDLANRERFVTGRLAKQ